MTTTAPPDEHSLVGRFVVLGVTGGIAAYKAVEVCRRLVDAGAHVAPVLTAGAQRFVGAPTFSALASEPVQTSLFDESNPIPHTRLGQAADLILIAPATARVLSDLATGRSSDLLVATVLASRAPVLVAPAMHTEMWEQQSVQANLATLRDRGVHVIDPESGRLAGGDVGSGRLADPATIVARAASTVRAPEAAVAATFEIGTAERSTGLAGRRVLVTAGGTREPIDPVRYLANRSSGKQGHAVAEEAAARGATTTLITTASLPSTSGIERVEVETAAQMANAVRERAGDADIVVMAAAVADFTPADPSSSKMKKSNGVPELVLVPTVDILAELGRSRRDGQVIVGFAAETDDVESNARDKLIRKGADLLVANDVSAPGVGFAHDTNEVRILDRSGASVLVPMTDKRSVAGRILDVAGGLLAERVAMPMGDVGSESSE